MKKSSQYGFALIALILSLAYRHIFLDKSSNIGKLKTMTTDDDLRPTVSDVYDRFAFHNRVVHNTVRRAISSVLHHCKKPETAQDTWNFMTYSMTTLRMLEQHHVQEDEIVLPVLKQHLPEVVQELEEQHQRIDEALGEAMAYCKSVRDDSVMKMSNWPDQISALFQRLSNVTGVHLDTEETGFSGAQLREHVKDEQVIVDLGKKIAVRAQADAEKTTDFAWLLTQMTYAERSIFFEAVPFIVRDFIFPVYTFRYPGCWKYSRAVIVE